MRTAGRGVLVDVASVAGYQPNPRMALYGATKAAEGAWRRAELCGGGLRE
ncbi:hypothetical protein ABZX90_35720 [Streptomyces sp. NPDC002935]